MSHEPHYRIHWVCSLSTPYNDFLFRSLAAEPDIDLTVHFIELRRGSHPWQSPVAVGFHHRAFQTVIGFDWHLLRLAWSDRESFFFLGSWREWTTRAVLILLSVLRRPFALVSDTPDLHKSRSPLKILLRRVFLPFVFSRSAAILATGRPAIQAFQVMGAPAARLVNFPFFVNLNRDQPAPTKACSDQILFIACGQLVQRKGYDLAIPAFAQALETGGHNQRGRARLLIAGDGPERAPLESLIAHLGLVDTVQVLGWLEPQAVQALLNQGDVFVHPARNDLFPASVLEAMAAGKPVIGSERAGSVVDRVMSGVNGFIHGHEKIVELAEHMVFFMEHPEEIKKMGIEARRTAEQWPVARGVQIIKSIVAMQG